MYYIIHTAGKQKSLDNDIYLVFKVRLRQDQPFSFCRAKTTSWKEYKKWVFYPFSSIFFCKVFQHEAFIICFIHVSNLSNENLAHSTVKKFLSAISTSLPDMENFLVLNKTRAKITRQVPLQSTERRWPKTLKKPNIFIYWNTLKYGFCNKVISER